MLAIQEPRKMVSNYQSKAPNLPLNIIKSLYAFQGVDQAMGKVTNCISTEEISFESKIADASSEEFILSSFGGMFTSSDFYVQAKSNEIKSDKLATKITSSSKKKKSIRFKKNVEMFGGDSSLQADNYSSDDSCSLVIDHDKLVEEEELRLTEVPVLSTVAVAGKAGCNRRSIEDSGMLKNEGREKTYQEEASCKTSVPNEVIAKGKRTSMKKPEIEAKEGHKAAPVKKTAPRKKREEKKYTAPKRCRTSSKRKLSKKDTSVSRVEVIDLKGIRQLEGNQDPEETVSMETKFTKAEKHLSSDNESVTIANELCKLDNFCKIDDSGMKELPVLTVDDNSYAFLSNVESDSFVVLSREEMTSELTTGNWSSDDDLPLISIKSSKDVTEAFGADNLSSKDTSLNESVMQEFQEVRGLLNIVPDLQEKELHSSKSMDTLLSLKSTSDSHQYSVCSKAIVNLETITTAICVSQYPVCTEFASNFIPTTAKIDVPKDQICSESTPSPGPITSAIDASQYPVCTESISSYMPFTTKIDVPKDRFCSKSTPSPGPITSAIDVSQYPVCCSKSTFDVKAVVKDEFYPNSRHIAALGKTAPGHKAMWQRNSYLKPIDTSFSQSYASFSDLSKLDSSKPNSTSATETRYDNRIFSHETEVSNSSVSAFHPQFCVDTNVSKESCVPPKKRQKVLNPVDKELSGNRVGTTNHLFSIPKVTDTAQRTYPQVSKQDTDGIDVSWSIRTPIFSGINGQKDTKHGKFFIPRENNHLSSLPTSKVEIDLNHGVLNQDFSTIKSALDSFSHVNLSNLAVSETVFSGNSCMNTNYPCQFESQNTNRHMPTEMTAPSSAHPQNQSSTQSPYDLLIGIKSQLNQIQENVDRLQQDFTRFKNDFYAQKGNNNLASASSNNGCNEMYLETNNNGISLSGPDQQLPKITLRGIKSIIIDGGG